MTIALYLALSLLVAGALFLALRPAIAAFLRFRGKRLVVCPENQHAASVEVSKSRAALSTLLGEEKIQLNGCSRWPEKEGCGQECVAQIASSPEGCLVKSVVNQWYHGRACVYCLRRFEDIQWHDHQPALATEDGELKQWSELKAEDLPDLFATARPVCWNCMIAETFRKEHPELVVDRHRRSA